MSHPSGFQGVLPRGPRPATTWRGEQAGRKTLLRAFNVRRPNRPAPQLMRRGRDVWRRSIDPCQSSLTGL
uniref:Uncharacterized protein n=1 Tax=Oryza sativa subsp. japonica TaxID=39947 RepID=Q8H408_ORYSJ|nr:hypothetical protein [Oryza sativa Japonica Group]